MSKDFDADKFLSLFNELTNGLSARDYTRKYRQLINYGSAAIPTLLQITKNTRKSDGYRGLAIQLLAETRDTQAIKAIIQVLGKSGLAHIAENNLEKLGEAAVPLLCESLLDYSLPTKVRETIARILGEIKSPKAVAALSKVLENIPDIIPEEDFAGTMSDLKALMNKIPESFMANDAFFKKYPQLKSSLEGYFFMGSFYDTSKSIPPYNTPEFQEDFNQAAELIVDEVDFETARTEAHTLLSPYFEEEVLGDIIEYLSQHRQEEKEDENRVRAEAAKALGWIGDNKAVEALLLGLKDPGARVRAASATAINFGNFTDERARIILLELMEDENSEVVDAATQSLRIFNEAPSQQQLELLEAGLYIGEKFKRYLAANSLSSMGEAGIDILLTALESEEEETMLAVISPLTFTHKPEIIPLLLAKLTYPSTPVRVEVAKALGYYAMQVKDDKSPVQALITIVENHTEEPELLKEAVQSLSWFEDKSAIAALVNLLKQELDSPPRKPERGASIDDSESKRFMERGNLRDALVKAMGHLKALESINLLVRVIENTGELDFRRAEAIRSLGYIGSPESFTQLLKATKDENLTIKEAGVVALGYLGDPRGFEPLVEAFYNGTRLIPGRAIEALGRLKDERSYEHLLVGLKNEDVLVRYSAARGLGEFGEAKAIPVLINMLEDENPEVRFEAAEALGNLRAKEAIPLLEKLASSDEAEVCFCCHKGATVAEGAKSALEAISI